MSKFAHSKNIILECANFDMYTLRKSSMRHGIFTDALTRFNKGQSALQNPYILDLLIRSVFDVAGGELASHIFDQSAELKPHQAVEVSVDFINERLGLQLATKEISQLLTNVEFIVEPRASSLEPLKVTPPFWRTDIELPEDVVEEVGRLYGFDKLPRELPVRSIAPASQNTTVEAKRRVRGALSRLGANEVLTYSFVHENVLKRADQNPEEAYRLGNALSPDLQYYRLSLTPSLLAHIHPNIKAGHDEFVLFEIGKAHGKSEVDADGLPKEVSRVAGVYAAGKKAGSRRTGAPYFVAKRYVSELFVDPLRYIQFTETEYQDHILFQQMLAPYDPQRSAIVFDGDHLVGVVGEFEQDVTKAFKLPEYAAGFELFLSAVEHVQDAHYQPLSRFPSVTQDISLKSGSDKQYSEIAGVVAEAISAYDTSEYVISYEPVSIYQPDAAETTYSFRINVTHMQRTLKDEEVSKIISEIAAQAQQVDATQV